MQTPTWKMRVDAQRAYVILTKIAKKRKATFNSVAEAFESVLDEDVSTPHDNDFNKLLNNLLKQSPPDELIKEMTSNRPNPEEVQNIEIKVPSKTLAKMEIKKLKDNKKENTTNAAQEQIDKLKQKQKAIQDAAAEKVKALSERNMTVPP